jgi:aspartate aminotransferase
MTSRERKDVMIASDLRELLEPLERFESIRRRATRLGPRLCDLSYANPYGGIEETARAVLREALEDDRPLAFQYSPFGGSTFSRRAVAEALRSSHHDDFAYRDVVLTPGAMAALHAALRSVSQPEGEVIVPVPCWLDYPLYVVSAGLTPVPVGLSRESFDLDVDAIAGALSNRTVAVLLSTPCNPTGRNYGTDQWARLGAAINTAQDRFGSEITLISDETHRDFTKPGEFTSPSGIIPRCLIVYSFGKYHFMQGQRLGYVATSPTHPDREGVSTELVRWMRILGFATPTSLMQRAVPGLLALRHDYAWLLSWRGLFADQLSSFGYSVVRPDATLFMYVQTPTGLEDFDFVERLAAIGILVLPAPLFHHRGYFRISLTGSEDMLEGALSGLKGFLSR